MGRSSIAAFSLCLLCLLENWQTGQAKKTADIKLDAVQQNMQNVNCKKGELIHITTAIWSGFDEGCPKRSDKTEKIRSRCENRQKCSFIPHWERDKAPHVNLGNLCSGHPEILRGNAECWNPCLGISCGEGGNCTSLTYNTYKCACNKGYENAGGNSNAACTRSKKTKDIKFEVKEKRRKDIGCDKGEVLHITNADWSASGRDCQKRADKTEKIRSRCENRQKCSFIPHWKKDYAPRINLGDLCYGYPETLRGNAECWNPCLGISCGEGGNCTSLTYNTYKCACNKGYENAGGESNAACTKSKKTKDIKFEVWQKRRKDIGCDEGEVLHITNAIWSVSRLFCRKSVDRTGKIRSRCEGRQKCSFIPHWKKNDAPRINLGDLCSGYAEKLRGDAECWNPCNTISCGEGGTCERVAYNIHKCACGQGYENTGGKADAVCKKSKRIRVIKKDVYQRESETIDCGEGGVIHIKSAIWSTFTSSCPKADRTETIRHRCEGLQSCKFIPHWSLDYLHNINLGDPCVEQDKRLKFEAECWNPCNGVSCEEGVCVPSTFQTHKCEKRDSRHTKTIRVANMETETEVLNCQEGELIHIQSVIWSGFVPHCNEKVDITEKVRERCGNHQKCEFTPLWFQEEGSLLLQSNCSKTGEYIRGEAQCWDPCLGAECGEGKGCAPLTYNTHKCV